MIQLPLCVAIITSLLFVSSVKSVTTSNTIVIPSTDHELESNEAIHDHTMIIKSTDLGAGTIYKLSVTQVLGGVTVVYEITSVKCYNNIRII